MNKYSNFTTMSESIKHVLFILVKSLSKSEKRQFKLYVNRLDINANAKFILLFNLLDKMAVYDEKKIDQAQIVKKQQLPNLSKHLYRNVLISLRSNPINQGYKIQLREQLDFASILYDRGLYNQSIKILHKTKTKALAYEEFEICQEIITFEKKIESEYITRELTHRTKNLICESEKIDHINQNIRQYTNLSLELYEIMLRTGYAKSDEEANQITAIFKKQLPQEVSIKQMSTNEKMWYYKVHLWYNLLIQDFSNAFKFAVRWNELFTNNEILIQQYTLFYLKSINHLLEVLYILRYKTQLEKTLKQFEAMMLNDTLPNKTTVKILSGVYLHFHRINLCFLNGRFEQGSYLIPKILHTLEENPQIDNYYTILFYYKIACLYFGKQDYENCLLYLDKIIEHKKIIIGADLMCFSRILKLIVYYELDREEINLEIKNTYKFLIKIDDLHQIQKEIIKFLRNVAFLFPQDTKKTFVTLYQGLQKYQNDPYEKRAFLYLDILSWLESKINNIPIGKVIQNKAKYDTR